MTMMMDYFNYDFNYLNSDYADDGEYDWLDFNEKKLLNKYKNKTSQVKLEREKETGINLSGISKLTGLSDFEFNKYRRNIFNYCRDGEYENLNNLLTILSKNFCKKTVSEMINSRFNGTRSIFICIENRNFKCFELLVCNGADLKLRKETNNILHIACINKYPEFINYILDNLVVKKIEKIINQKNYFGLTPLQIYISRKDDTVSISDVIIRKMIKSGSSLNISEKITNKSIEKIVKNIIKEEINKNFIKNNELCSDIINTIMFYIR